jgi:signal transduction histidine kinase/ligand-binding sensor domain-containing protein/DNA-binding response OmpR family regulator
MMKKLYVFLALIFLALQIFAQRDKVHFIRADIYKGLSNNQVNSIYRDDKGFAWLGTMSGLNRYDGYTFKVFRTIATDSNSINDNFIDKIFPYPGKRMLVRTRKDYNIYDPQTEKFDRDYASVQRGLQLPDTLVDRVIADSQKNYWFIYTNKGLWQYRDGAKPVLYDASPNTAVKLPYQNVTGVCESNDGMLWIIYRNGFLQKLDWQHKKIVYSTNAITSLTNNSQSVYGVFCTSNGDCWVFSEDQAKGAYKISFGNGNPQVVHYDENSPGARLNANIVSGITEDREGNIWIATNHGGINLVNNKTGKITYLVNNAEDPRSISQNAIISIFRDREGIIWAGTYKQGFNYFNENLAKFPLYKHLANNPSSLPFEDVNRFAEDAKGNLWIGTNGGGLIYFDRSNHSFKRWMAGPGSISNNVIVSLCIDSEGKLLIGSYFGGLDVFDGKTFKNYRHDASDPNSISDDRVWEIFEDSKKNTWIGTLGGGLDRFDKQTGIFYHNRAGGPNSLRSDYISAIIEDRLGNLWIGTAIGFDQMKPGGKLEHFEHSNDTNSLSNNNVIDLLEDSRGLLWVGTREGLGIFDPAKKLFRNYSTQHGLPDNTILKILEDESHNIWISTPNGLSRVKVELKGNDTRALKLVFQNYDELNNLQAREFNENAALKTLDNELIFGGPFGFNIFKPSEIIAGKHKSSVILTGLDVFNKPVAVGEKMYGSVLLQESVSSTKGIKLKYRQNVFSITFASLDFSHTENDKYAYILEGFNKNWFITDGTLRRATFTNLNPGDYTFRVKTVNSDGSFSKEEAVLHITVLPPFWLTPLAFFLYFLLIVAALWFARRMVLQRAKMRFDIERERAEARRMHELDLMKIRFITNVSHEFRTPLSLILSPVDKLVKTTSDTGQKKQLQLIHRNARRLLNLVNQLLDFRRMEVQEFSFIPDEADVVSFIKDISFSFTDIAEKKNIRFSFHSTVAQLVMPFDADKMEKILFNLLSNAYKFTPEGGEIKVLVDWFETRLGSLEELKYLQVTVSDTGIGIPEANKEKIFERFFQNPLPGNIINQGSGIGLAIVKEFVRLHSGTIHVESEPDKGSSFIMQFPVNNITEPVPAKELLPQMNETVVEREEMPKLRGPRNTVLIVEDNEDFRFYLKDNLGLHFRILEAANGKDGWQKTQEMQPDLVVSDIMMPVMNGLELARKIKHDPRTSAIPVILLTARTEEEQQLEGLDTGANDYISKPFSFEILLSRVRNLLSEQKSSKRQVKQITVNASEVTIESGDEKLVQDALKLVEKNMSNADFSVEDLSRELFLSRVGLYKKLVVLTGKTPIEFIKDIRMARATQLLQNSKMTVSEVAYEVGYDDPKYFAKAFKKEFGVLPSGYSARQTANGNKKEES